MKKTISTVIIGLSFFMAHAQIGKGATALGLSLAATYNVNKSTRASTFNTPNYEVSRTTQGLAIQPFLEYFVGKNLSFGIGFNYGINLISEKNTFGTSTSKYDFNLKSYGLQVQFKKYWFATKKIAFTFTPAIAALYNDIINENTSSNGIIDKNTIDYWGYGIGVNLGAAYFIKHNIMVEGQTNFYTYYYTPETSQINYSSNYTISVIPTNLSLGLKFVFGNKANSVKVD